MDMRALQTSQRPHRESSQCNNCTKSCDFNIEVVASNHLGSAKSDDNRAHNLMNTLHWRIHSLEKQQNLADEVRKEDTLAGKARREAKSRSKSGRVPPTLTGWHADPFVFTAISLVGQVHLQPQLSGVCTADARLNEACGFTHNAKTKAECRPANERKSSRCL